MAYNKIPTLMENGEGLRRVDSKPQIHRFTLQKLPHHSFTTKILAVRHRNLQIIPKRCANATYSGICRV